MVHRKLFIVLLLTALFLTLNPTVSKAVETGQDVILGAYDSDSIRDLAVSDNNYGFYFKKDEKGYVNVNGKEYGPYDDVNRLKIVDTNWGFQFKKDNKWYVNIRDKEYGPYDYDNCLNLQLSTSNWGFTFYKDNKWYVNINGKEYGPYTVVEDPSIAATNWGIEYEKEGGHYVNVNGAEYGPYETIGRISISDKNWGFVYNKKDVGNYAIINGKEYKGISSLDISISNSGWGFSYLKDGAEYININDVIYGPYDSPSGSFLSIAGRNWGFVFHRDGKFYANINGKENGPYDDIVYLRVSDTSWMFIAGNNFVYSVIINGNRYGPYDNHISQNRVLVSDTNVGFVYISNLNGQFYVNINRGDYGPYTRNADIEDNTSSDYIYGKIDTYPHVVISGENWGFTSYVNGSSVPFGEWLPRLKRGFYVTINGKEYGPYYWWDKTPYDWHDMVPSISMTNENWGFVFVQGSESYVNINGTEYGHYNLPTPKLVMSDKNWAFAYEKDNGSYVMIHNGGNASISTLNTNIHFSDVPSSHQYSTDIGYVKNAGIVEGYTDGTYKPDADINRAEFTKIIMSAIYASNPDSSNCFPDVKSDWYAKYVCLAKTNNIISGYDDGTFKPTNSIRFSEAAKIIVQAFGINVIGTSPWYEAYVHVLKERDAIPPSVGTQWDKFITRGEMAYMIYKMKTYTSTSSHATTGTLQQPINANVNGGISLPDVNWGNENTNGGIWGTQGGGNSNNGPNNGGN